MLMRGEVRRMLLDRPHMSLKNQLKTFKREFERAAEPGVVEAMQRGDSILRASGIVSRALKAGDLAPEFSLPDANGKLFTLSKLLDHGPVVVSFYRGSWCDYCSLELSALAAINDQVKDLGATLVAISPPPIDTPHPKTANAPPFPLLIDSGANVSKRFGVAFSLPEELRPIYTKLGRPSAANHPDDWLLPIPATYIIDRNACVALSYLDADYTSRLEPAEIISALTCLRNIANGRGPS